VTPFELTSALIDIPSISGSEEKMADYLAGFLEGQSWKVKRQPVEGNRCNLLATLGAPPKVLLCTHMDTVPPFIAASEDETHIYGRGACDTKGIIAAMLFAADELRRQGIETFGLLFLIAEETDSIGARKANELNVGCDFIVVGEPTENKLAIGHKGCTALALRAHGTAGHSAYPHLGESAIHKLLLALARINEIDFPADPVLGEQTMNVGLIAGGVAHNVIAAEARAQVSFRNVQASSDVLERVRKTLGDGIEIGIITQSDPQKLYAVDGFDQIVVPFCTDIPHLKNFGRPLLIGPGSILFAHTAEERIAKTEIMDAIRLYQELVKRLLDTE
jgi:acetylornithine deacetylase